MADLYYIESGYFDPSLGYYVYTADAASEITSTASITCAVGVIKQGQSALASAFTQSAIGSRTKDIDLFAFSEAMIAAQVNAIRSNNVDTSSVFSIATDDVRVRYASIDDMAFSTVFVGDNIRIRYSEAAVDAAFSLTADLQRAPGITVEGSGDWSSTASLECQAQRTKDITNCDLTATFSLSADANRLRGVESPLQSYISLNAAVGIVKQTAVSLDSSFVQTTSVGKIISASADISGVFDSQLSINVTKNSFAILDSVSTVSAAVTKTTGITAALASTASINAAALKIKSLAADLSATANISVNGGKLNAISLALSSQATLFANRYAGNGRPRQWAVTNSLAYSNSITKYGTHSLYLNAGTDYAFSEASGEFLVKANENFVFEMWVYKNGDPTFNLEPTYAGVGRLQNNNSGRDMRNFNSADDHWAIGSNFTNRLQFKYNNAGTVQTITTTQTVAASSWFHVAIRRTNGNTLQLLYNNSVVGSATFSGAFQIPSSSTWSRLGLFNGLGSSPTNMYYDEISYKIGSDQIDGYSSQIYNDPSTQVILLHLDNNLTDDISVTAFASAALSSTASISAVVTKAVLGSAALSSISTVQAQISAIRSAAANLSCQGFEIITPGKLKQFTADLISTSSLSALVGPLRAAQAQLTSTATTSVTGQRIRFASASFSAFNSELVAGDRVRSTRADLVSTASVTATITKTTRITAGLQSIATANITAAAVESDLNLTSWILGVRVDNTQLEYIGTTDILLDETTDTLYELVSWSDRNTNTYGSGIVARESHTGTILWTKYYRLQRGSASISLPDTSNLVLDNGYLYWAVNTASGVTPQGSRIHRLALSDYTLTTFAGLGTTTTQLTIDSGSIYAAGYQTGQTNNIFWLAKYTTSGTVTWQISDAYTGNSQPAGITVKNNQVYLATRVSTGSVSGSVYKIDPADGTKLAANNYLISFEGINQDSNGDIWLWGQEQFVKINTDLTVVLSKRVDITRNSTTKQVYIRDLKYEVSSNRVYAIGYELIDNSPPNQPMRLFRFNPTNNTVDWTTAFDGVYNGDYGEFKLLLDSNKKFYWSAPGPLTGDTGTIYDTTMVARGIKLTGGLFYNNYAFKSPNDSAGTFSYDTITNVSVSISNKTAQSNSTTLANFGNPTSSISTPLLSLNYQNYIYVYAVWGAGQLTSTATVTATVTKIRGYSAALVNTATVTITAVKTARAGAAISTTATVTAIAVKTVRTGSTISSAATVTADVRRQRNTSVTLTSTASLAALGTKTARTTASISSVSTLTAGILRIRSAAALLPSIATELTVAVKNATGTVTLESRATITAQTADSVTRRLSAALTGTATLTADVENIVGFKIDLANLAQLTTVNGRIRYNSSSLNTTATATTTAAKTARTSAAANIVCTLTAQPYDFTKAQAALTASSQLTLTITRNRDSAATLISTATISTTAARNRLASAALASEFTPLFFINRIVRIEANLATQGFILAVGDVIKIDPFLTLTVEPETRYLLVLPENRILAIEQETRILTIEGI